MAANKKDLKHELIDSDDAPEWAADVFDRAQIAVSGKIIRGASGTLTKRGRPPVGDESKQQVTLRLAPQVIRYFKASGKGWQTRLNSVLERHVSGALREYSRPMPRAVTGVYAMAKNEKTSKRAGAAASKVLRSGSTGKNSKTAAGSALTQRPDKKKK
ncbi:BrnA antitoxin family protein [Sphingomonas daechungensis]|uniref:BrnA antitoxin family protein n=1 Tax=Sphingomonas daechungensis TaxID=1176646 RepID=UPI0037845512